MLIALLTAYLVMHFSSDSSALSAPFAQAAERIKKDVSDGERQKQALKIVDQMKSGAQAYTQKRDSSMDILVRLLAKRTTPATDIEHSSQSLIDEDRARALKLLDLRFELKSVLTASEWAKVFPVSDTYVR
jgi:Fic family protein